MKSKSLSGMKRLNKVLSGTSWTNFRKILGSLVLGSNLEDEAKTSILSCLRDEDVSGLVNWADALTEQQYIRAEYHFSAHQIASLIKKYPYPSHLNPFDPEKEALNKFIHAEKRCSELNEKFSTGSLWDPEKTDLLWRMRSFISYVLGDKPDLQGIYDRCDFGPGASIGVSGNASNLKRKIASDWTVTPSALTYAFAAVRNDWNLLQCIAGEGPICLDGAALAKAFASRVSLTKYNKIGFVPKVVKTHRVIATEPLLNGFLQKGVDAVMRLKLKRVGIDLSDQTINTEMARLGSLNWQSDESFATIDLSAASDSIAREVVRTLLPPEWFDLLDSLRSKYYKISNEVTPYEKFCSMGNGFCFPLETLIFVAACHAVGCGAPGIDFHVYGDDIIVRRKHASSVISLLEYLGFETNTKKTFISGPFRESCGRDWFAGKDVRPFVLDFALDNIQNVFKFLNLSRRSALTELFFADSFDSVLNLLPHYHRLFRPYKGPADTGIDSRSRDEFMSSRHCRWNFNLQCWEWRELISYPLPDKGDARDVASATMIAALRGASSSEPFVYRRKTGTTVRFVSYG